MLSIVRAPSIGPHRLPTTLSSSITRRASGLEHQGASRLEKFAALGESVRVPGGLDDAVAGVRQVLQGALALVVVHVAQAEGDARG